MIPKINPYRRGDPKDSFFMVTWKDRKTGIEHSMLTNQGGVENCRMRYEDEPVIDISQGLFHTIVKAENKETYMRDLCWAESVRKGNYDD